MIYLKFGMMALDVAISFSPAGWAKDTYEAVTGKGLVSGVKLDGFSRGAAIVGAGVAVGVAVVGSGGLAVGVAAMLPFIGKVLKEGKVIEEGAEALKEAEALLGKLAEQGVKHYPDDIISIAKKTSGKIVFLEKGNMKSGLVHILDKHAGHFADVHVGADQIPDTIMDALINGKIVGTQGSANNLRNIYEIEVNGNKVTLTVGEASNGYIVTAHPARP